MNCVKCGKPIGSTQGQETGWVHCNICKKNFHNECFTSDHPCLGNAPICPIDGLEMVPIGIRDPMVGDRITWMDAWYCPSRHEYRGEGEQQDKPPPMWFIALMLAAVATVIILILLF